MGAAATGPADAPADSVRPAHGGARTGGARAGEPSVEPSPTAAGEPSSDRRGGPARAATARTRADGPERDPSASGSGGDRRIVTALFADLVDYVRLVAEHDPEEVRRRVDAALVAMVDAIQSFDGTREKFIGDAVFAVFGWPVAHDDDALRATHCALAIRAGLANLDDPSGEILQVRIGIATGEVVAAPRELPGSLDWSLTGPAVTTAARIQGVAEPGEILLDEATIRAARKGLAIEDLGERVLRGQTRPVRIGRLLGEAGFQPWRPLVGRFVGRTAERDAIRAMLADLRVHGTGATVLVEGEAGIGKSRLLAEFEVDARRVGLAWTWVDNVSYGGNEPYRFGRSLAQIVADEHGTDSGTITRQLLFTDDVDPIEARRWAGAIAAIARDAAFSGWEAEAVHVPVDAAEVARDVRAVAVRYIERLLDLDGPRVIVVDDLHWIDPSSAGQIEELIAMSARLPLAILIGSRPEGIRVRPAGDHVRSIVLEGLDEAQTGELAGAVAGTAFAASDVRQLYDRTSGNPLFIGETVRAIVDEGAITADGRLSIAGGNGSVVPVTLRALLGSRIDALSPDARTVIRVGSVVGMTFREETIEEVLDTAVDATVYERLADAAMIVPLDATGGWRFCHPLIHDAAYTSLLATDRRSLHGRVADRIERSQPTASVGVIARHRAAAGDAARALPLLVRAGEQAIGLGAAEEAAAYFSAAADLVTGPESEALLRRSIEARAAVPAEGR